MKTTDNGQIRGIENGPYGGTSLMIGDELAGNMITAPRGANGDSWGAVRLSDYALAQTAYELSRSKLWLPGWTSPTEFRIVTLGEIGILGSYHLDIIGPVPRGPFDKVAPSPTATYPALWNHDAKKETRIVCEPDSQLQVRQGMEDKAARVWDTASHSHLNLDYTFGSQPLAVAFTDQESLGGSVWGDVTFSEKRFDQAFSVWANSTLGLLSYWWHSSRSQSSKAR